MSWVTLTEAKFLQHCTGAETQAIKTAALGTGQGEPLTDLIARVVQEVRGYVAAYRQNTLGEGSTIPQELESAALAIVRYRALNRLPVKSLLTDTRIAEHKEALTLLRDVAGGRFSIEQPATASEQITSGTSSPSITAKTRTFTREDADGI